MKKKSVFYHIQHQVPPCGELTAPAVIHPTATTSVSCASQAQTTSYGCGQSIRHRSNRQILKSMGICSLFLLGILTPSYGAPPPQIALVLSGGGARGLAQIGVLKCFEEHALKPDLIVATSMGSIIGGLWACGFSADTIASLARTIDWDKIYGNNSTRRTLFLNKKDELSNALFELRFDYQLKPVFPNALSSGQAFYDILAPILDIPQFNAAANFDSLQIPLRIIATDLISGEKVVFSQGNICTALRASCAVPLAFTPVEVDSFYLVDGGIMSNIPVEVAHEAAARHVIAVDVTSPPWTKQDLSSPVKLVDQIVSIGSRNQRRNTNSAANFIITPDLGTIRNTDFTLADSIIAQGYAVAESLFDSLATAIGYPPSSGQLPAMEPDIVRMKHPVVHKITVSGNLRTRESLIIRSSGIQTGDTLFSSTIRKAITSIYATDLFENVNIDIDTSGTCNIACKERLYYRTLMGLRFDEFHLGEGYIEPAYENCFGNGSILLMHLQYGLRREKYTIELKGNHLLTRNIASTLHFQLYSSKEKILEADTIVTDSTDGSSSRELHEHTLRKTGSIISAETQLGRSMSVGMDLRIEKFRVQKNDAGVLSDILGIELKKSLPYLSLKFSMDSMDKYPFPVSGTQIFLTLGGATETFGGKYTFIKCSGMLSRFFTVHKRHTFIPKLSFGWANNPLPAVERVYIGGSVTESSSQEISVYNYLPFFGLSPRAINRDCYSILHAEYRGELKKKLYAHIALDWGPSWNATAIVDESLVSDAPLGIGVGISYQSIAGPLKLYFGQLLKESKQYFSEGREFFYFSAGYDF